MKLTDADVNAYATGRAVPRQISPEAMRVLAMELQPLRGLATCPFIAEAVGALTADVEAEHAPDTLPRLRAWAARWQRVRADIRAFYEREDVHQSRAGMWGLRRVLTGEGTASGPLRGELNRLWRAEYGSDPAFSLIPKIDL